MPQVPDSDLADIFKDSEGFVDECIFTGLPGTPKAGCYFSREFADALQTDGAVTTARLPTSSLPAGELKTEPVTINGVPYKIKQVLRNASGITDLILNK